ncbi:hypothetical protein BV61_03465 [Candidatus Synechococcus spongiarum LMB bulk15M]|uniref:Uncharacterized protein n=1 Tax=Candidatus Synechococcus spongiarum LMB bulk15M TaxID=1943582 RepID=A0A1T1CZN3_9SYNE|nr:hypothetical protein BV61_03465 [Candidatus Synechococcus spongiarum LMB bulk15M]
MPFAALIRTALAIETESGPRNRLPRTLRKTVPVHGLEGLASLVYAQTITYGLASNPRHRYPHSPYADESVLAGVGGDLPSGGSSMAKPVGSVSTAKGWASPRWWSCRIRSIEQQWSVTLAPADPSIHCDEHVLNA